MSTAAPSPHSADVVEPAVREILTRAWRRRRTYDAVDFEELIGTVSSSAGHDVSPAALEDHVALSVAMLGSRHYQYSDLAGDVAQNALAARVHARFPRFSDGIAAMRAYVHPKTGAPAPLIAEDVAAVVAAHADALDALADGARFDATYFSVKTLERSYFLKINDEYAETPVRMYLRVAVGIHGADMGSVEETFRLLVDRRLSHATPTLFNAGTPRPQCSSCFLIHMKDDSIDGIYDTLKTCACISKYAGGIGLSIHNIRATDSYIRGTNGSSNGLVPMLRVYSDTARYVDQGGGKRKGSFAIYLEPWHADIFDWLELKKNHGKEEARARDLFYALWTPDLFMRRVASDGDWTLFCPNEAPGLGDVWGAEFDALYERYEREGRGRRTVRAARLFMAVMESQIETGTPYMLFKDACNRSSNHQHLGTIKSSNLCCEIVQYTSPEEVAVCNLAAVVLSRCVDAATRTFDFDALQHVTRVALRNLNRVIDRNFYPVPEARTSNMRHRPVGIGVMGLADTFAMLGLAFDDPGARELNARIFEHMYYAAVDASCELARAEGAAYPSFAGSPLSRGVFHFEMTSDLPVATTLDWDALRRRVVAHGVRNSLFIACMPCASTAHIVGVQEAMEPFTSLLYARQVLAGEFLTLNRLLVDALAAAGRWTPDVYAQLVQHKGSVQAVPGVPEDIKHVFRTVWEYPHRVILEQSADRQPFVDQAQSLNAHLATATIAKLSSMHMFAWKQGLKTGMYYLRTQAKADAKPFHSLSLDAAAAAAAAATEASKAPDEGPSGSEDDDGNEEEEAATAVCPLRGPRDSGCVMCSS